MATIKCVILKEGSDTGNELRIRQIAEILMTRGFPFIFKEERMVGSVLIVLGNVTDLNLMLQEADDFQDFTPQELESLRDFAFNNGVEGDLGYNMSVTITRKITTDICL